MDTALGENWFNLVEALKGRRLGGKGICYTLSHLLLWLAHGLVLSLDLVPLQVTWTRRS